MLGLAVGQGSYGGKKPYMKAHWVSAADRDFLSLCLYGMSAELGCCGLGRRMADQLVSLAKA